jgi:adenosylmethionine-8-amino-7-oxononanoate aminotransferase
MKELYGGPLAGEVSRRSFNLGAAVYLCSPAVDAVLLCPPFVISEEEIRSLGQVLVQAVRDVLQSREDASLNKS